tara:strand:+ start:4432 stop:6300 length:1869 start_codon:yes stop_codon:yes gene_type:complete
MKKLVFGWVLVLLTFSVQAQWPAHVDSSKSMIFNNPDEFADALITPTVEAFVVLEDNTIHSDLYLNGVRHDALIINSDPSSIRSKCIGVGVVENEDSTLFTYGSYINSILDTVTRMRLRMFHLSNPDSTILAINFHGVIPFLTIKRAFVSDSSVYILTDAIMQNTLVSIVQNNGPAQSGGTLTGVGAGFLRFDRFTGSLLKQVYFHHNDNDGGLNLTFWNTSMIAVNDDFYFSSVSSLGENFILHGYNRNLDSVSTYAIATDTSQSKNYPYYAKREMAYGSYKGEDYLGVIAETVPVIINLSTGVVNYIEDISKLMVDHPYGSTGAFFVDSSFIFFHGFVKRVELSTMKSSIIRHDWITDDPNLHGYGISSVQQEARVGGLGFMAGTLLNGEIQYYSRNTIHTTHPGLYLDGNPILSYSVHDDDHVVSRGSIDLSIDDRPGTETQFLCAECDSVQRIGHLVRYVVSDSSKLSSLHITRIKGVENSIVGPEVNSVIDFSTDTTIISFTLDYLKFSDLTTMRQYVEKAIVISPDTNDSSGISIPEEKLKLSLYPNPFHDHLNIPQEYQNKNYTFTLFNVSGKVIFKEHDISERVNLSTLTSGMYFVHIIDRANEPVLVQRVIKK